MRKLTQAELVESFWSRVNKDGPIARPGLTPCWTWTGYIVNMGYGQFYIGGKYVGAHRFAWELEHGQIPPGMCACHICDNPVCVRASHLFLGTRGDNAHDRHAKDRDPHVPSTTRHLTAEEAEEIRRLYREEGLTQRELAARFDLGSTTVAKLIRYETYHPHGQPRPAKHSANRVRSYRWELPDAEMAALYAGGMSIAEIAAKYKIDSRMVKRHLDRQWKEALPVAA